MKDYIFYQDSWSIEDKLKNLKFDWKGKSVLDLGCNIGTLGKYVTSRGAIKYTGIDQREREIEEAKKRNPEFKFFTGDIFDYTYYNSDVLVALSLFHHLKSEENIIKVLSDFTSKELIIEVPVQESKNEADLKRDFLLPENRHRELIEFYYGPIKEELVSGWRNRKIFVCEARYP